MVRTLPLFHSLTQALSRPVHTADDPSDTKGTDHEHYMRAMYLSHRDAVGFFSRVRANELI